MDTAVSDPTPMLVRRAQSGDRAAFERLVERYQDMAVGFAVGRIADPAQARDVAQEAFIDAFLHLGDLRQPAAFGAWLRRIVHKHCDRVTRGKARRALTPVERVPETAGEDAESALGQRQRQQWLHLMIEQLPEHERIAVALHYIAGHSHRQIGELLEIEPNAVKQRLHSARRRLERRSSEMIDQDLEAMRPSRDPAFSGAVRFFLAVRSGDLETARAALRDDPALVHAQELWSREEMQAGGLPVPSLATPLIRAAAGGDVAMIDLLLAHGAEVEGRCGCKIAERPLFEAVAAGHVAAATRLLEAGADPNARGLAGHSALHVAAIRGLDALYPVLLAHGADPDQRDDNGRRADDWMRAREGRAAASPELAQAGPWLMTGIKALDLFAPIRVGAIVRVVGGAMVGRNVLMAELSTIAKRRDIPCVWGAWHRADWQGAEVAEYLAETGLRGQVELLEAGPYATHDERRELPARLCARAHELLDAGAGHVLLTIFEETGHVADVEAILPHLGQRSNGAITCLLVRRWQDVDGGAVVVRPPVEAVYMLDPALARVGHFPAIHPLHTRSQTLDDPGLGPDHAVLAERARALLATHRAAVPVLDDAARAAFDVRTSAALTGYRVPIARLDAEPASSTAQERVLHARARRLQAFLTQPFHITEFAVGQLGQSVGRDALLDGVRAILDGAADDLAPERLLYGGALPT